MPIVSNVVRTPAGAPVPDTVVTVALVTSGADLPGFTATATVVGETRIVTDDDGEWSIDLVPNSQVLPTGTHYRITEKLGSGGRYTYAIVVPPTGGPYTVREVLAAAPANPDPLTPIVGDGAVASVDGRTGIVSLSDLYASVTALAGKAPLASPAFTGTVTGITKGMVGLSNVDNTTDAAKPISTATATALASKADLIGGLVPTGQLPSLVVTDVFPVANQAAMLALTAQRGDVAVRTDTGRTYMLATDNPSTLADWKELPAVGAITSVNGQQGIVVLGRADVGLGNVDNTSDADKPISTATAAALAGKAATGAPAAAAAAAVADHEADSDPHPQYADTAAPAAAAADAVDGHEAASNPHPQYASATHSHTIPGVTGLQAALDGKQPAGEYATSGELEDLAEVVDGKQAAGSYATTGHTHTIANVTNLQTALDGKQAAGSYATAGHTHNIAGVTGLQDALDGKQTAGDYATSSEVDALTDKMADVEDMVPVVLVWNEIAAAYEAAPAARIYVGGPGEVEAPDGSIYVVAE